MAASQVQDEAFVTLATNDKYAYGALVLAHSLRAVDTSRQLAIMITPSVSSLMRQLLSEVFDNITQVNPLDSNDEANLALLTRPELGITFSKLHCWRLTQYNKCVFMDADTLVLRNIDELFDREELSAAPDVGWPDLFNSGVFVFKPSNETYGGLLQCAVTQGSFDGGDQGLLNTYFSDWATKDIARHLPFIYNMTASRAYSYLPAFVRYGSDVKVVHFIGAVKPWNFTYDTNSGTVLTREGLTSPHEMIFIQAWWDFFVSKVKPRLQARQAEDPDSRPTEELVGFDAPPMQEPEVSPQQAEHMDTPDDRDIPGLSADELEISTDPGGKHFSEEGEEEEVILVTETTQTEEDPKDEIVLQYIQEKLEERKDPKVEELTRYIGEKLEKAKKVPGQIVAETIETEHDEHKSVPVHHEKESIDTEQVIKSPESIAETTIEGVSMAAGGTPMATGGMPMATGGWPLKEDAEETKETGKEAEVEEEEGAKAMEIETSETPGTEKSSSETQTQTELPEEMGQLKLEVSPVPSPSSSTVAVGEPVDSRTRQWQWEQGQIDYLGQDRFDNIMKKIDEKTNDK